MLTVVLWLLVPVVDCLRVIPMRVLQGRSPFEPDKNHLHHRLDRRWGWPKCLVIYLALVVIPGGIGALAARTQPGDDRAQPGVLRRSAADHPQQAFRHARPEMPQADLRPPARRGRHEPLTARADRPRYRAGTDP